MRRREIGQWIRKLVPIETLVPEITQRWRPLVRDAIEYIFMHLSEQRLAPKLSEQMALPLDTPSEIRLLQLISKMPGLQKVGQVLARNRRLPPKLREALSELENGMSDVSPGEIRAVIETRLGERLDQYAVRIAPEILSEATCSAVMKFRWCQPGREREDGVFKVLKPHVPACFAEDMQLLQRLGEYLAAEGRKYGFAVREVKETLEEVRLLLEHELDIAHEQAALAEAARMYRSSFGIRVPRVIRLLCAEGITAMSSEAGVKVTEAFRRSPIRRERIADQIIEALIAVPFFSWEDAAVFHADPHAGNLLYDEPNRELVVLDWALAERLDRESRRQLVLLAMMTILRNPDGVCTAIQALSRRDHEPGKQEMIREHVMRLFEQFPEGQSPGVLDAMMLLDEIAMEGVRFPAALFLFRKVLFTLDGVLHDVAGHEVRIDQVIIREFLARAVASFGVFHAPLKGKDMITIQREALWYPMRRLRIADGPALAGR
ncbi:MAG TPA: AarF/UbiB family protein [Bryobacteraceae bacterium]|nr:AarF/UbiB family protein [Bryobacteraceae bacterium]